LAEGLPLSEKRIRELRDNSHRRIENFQRTWNHKREVLLKSIYDAERLKILPFSKRELFLSGLFLYWGEGAKTKSIVWISNTDPAVIRAFMRWAQAALEVNTEKIIIRLHLYKDMDVAKETKFWSNALALEAAQFRRPYIKASTLKSLTYKGGFGHGTCNAMINDAALMRRIQMGLKVLRDHFTGP